MIKIFFLCLFFCATATMLHAVEQKKVVFNPYTGKFDYIVNIGSTPVTDLLNASTTYILNRPESTQDGGYDIQTGTVTGQMYAGEFVETTGSPALTGTFSLARQTKTSDFTANNNSTVYFCNALGSSITVTLPDATQTDGRIYYFIKIDSSTNRVGLYPQSGQTVGFESKFELKFRGESLPLISDKSNWIGF